MIILNQQPHSPLLDFGNSSASPFVPQITIPAPYQQLLNLQCGLARGSFWTQAEWYGTVISQINGPAVFYHGCHVDCGYFLTGENRGVLGRWWRVRSRARESPRAPLRSGAWPASWLGAGK